MISIRKTVMTLCLVWVSMIAFAQPEVWKTLEKPLNFLLANDLGRNGYYDQKPIAELMGNLAEVDDQLRIDLQTSGTDVAVVCHPG